MEAMILSISLDLEMRFLFNSVGYDARIPINGANRGPKVEVSTEILWSTSDVIAAAEPPSLTLMGGPVCCLLFPVTFPSVLVIIV